VGGCLDAELIGSVGVDRPVAQGLDVPVEEHLKELVTALDAGWRLMAERLEEAGEDAKVSIEVQPNGRAKLNVDALGALGEPKSLHWLRRTVEKMLPKIDLRTFCSRCTPGPGSWTPLCTWATAPPA
jgi:hypothetical protein